MRTRAAALLLLLCGAAAAATGLAGAAGQQTAAEDATMPADSAWLDGSSRKLLQAVKDCTRTHKACSQCRNQRIPGTRKTEQVCSACITGWRVRQNGPNKSKVCDCGPGMAMNASSAAAPGAWCVPCPMGQYCAGGDNSKNPDSQPTACPPGLATAIVGAKSQAQCFTLPGFGRVSTRGNNGQVELASVVCEVGTYNVGKNSAGCQRCGPGLTTVAPGANSSNACVAPAGMYYDRGYAKSCPKGTFSTTFNTDPACTPCPDGVTTATEGSNSSTACGVASKGFFFDPVARTAVPCPLNTFSDSETLADSCTPCPNGWRTKEEGATGAAMCLAPPGWELKDGGSAITECEVGFYKADWNRNPCVACGKGLATAVVGSVSKDACLVPAGAGLVSLFPLQAVPCVNGSYGDNVDRPAVAGSRCSTCGPNMLTPDLLEDAVSPAGGYTSEDECRLQPGWGMTQTMVERCPVGTFNPGKNRLPCEACPNGYTTLAEGKTSRADCVIQPGWELDTKLNLPRPCDKGTYSVGGTEANPNGTCVACAKGRTTQVDQSTKEDDCNVCEAGYGAAGCAPCAYNTWSAGGTLDGDGCQACAAGSVSARGSQSSIECYPAMQAADDVFQVSDEAKWVAQAATTSASCSYSCSESDACIMYRWAIGTTTCQLLMEEAGANPSQQLAFKVLDGSDYVVYQVSSSFTVGTLVQTLTGRTLQQCMQACTNSGSCGLVSFPTGADSGTCKLWGSSLDADWDAMVHIQGDHLFSDKQIVV